MTAAFVLKNFSYSYPGAVAALRDVNLRIDPGEFVVVAGRSGSGKSTLLRAAAGLVPHHFGGSVRGDAYVCGEDLRTHRTADLAAHCGCVLQDPESQIVMGSVRHEIAFPLENLGHTQRSIDFAVEATAEALEISDLLDRRTAELSGGELQRVVLAAALAPGPPLLVLDEPTAQLDPVSATDFYDALRSACRQRGTTVLIAEHRLDAALESAGRALALDGGEIAFDGSPAAFLDWAASDLRGAALLPPERYPYPRGARAQLAPADTVLSLDAVEYSHPGAARPALAGADIALKAGERVALMGPNGSGKSTLLRVARGLIEPSSGSRRAAGEIGLLLQNPNDYLIHDRVADEAPAEALDRFGLSGKADRDPRDLSGGERQRLALAIVMQQQPAALLLDEPTRGMDRERKLDLLTQLEAVSAAGTAVLLATHDRALVSAFADRVLRMEAGRPVEDRLRQPAVPPLEAGSRRLAGAVGTGAVGAGAVGTGAVGAGA